MDSQSEIKPEYYSERNLKPNKVFIKSISNTISAFTSDKFISDITNFQSHNSNSASSSYYGSNSNINKNLRKKCPATFLQIYFDFAYYILLSPFRIIVSEETGKFTIRKWRLQQLACGILQLCCALRLFTDVRDVLQLNFSSGKQSPIQYFSIVQNVASAIYKLEVMRRFWFHQKDYLRIFNFIQDSSYLHSHSCSTVLVHKNFIRLVFGVFVALPTASIIVGKFIVPEVGMLSPSLWLNQLIKLARYMLFIDDTVFNYKDSCMLSNVKGSDVVAAVFILLCVIPRTFIGYFSDLCILSCAIPFWVVAKSFSNAVAGKDVIEQLGDYPEQNNHGLGQNYKWPEIYRYFREIQGLSHVINTALGSLVTCYIAEAIMYYSRSLTSLITSPDIFMRIDKLTFYATTFCIFLFSADICNQLQSIKLWLYHGSNKRSVPADEFNLVLHEMIVKDIGIRGSNTFTITYSLLALFLSTIVTFFIICVQDGNGDHFPLQMLPGSNSSCPKHA